MLNYFSGMANRGDIEVFIAGVPLICFAQHSASHLSLTESSRLGLTFRKQGNNFEGLWVNIHAEFDRIE